MRRNLAVSRLESWNAKMLLEKVMNGHVKLPDQAARAAAVGCTEERALRLVENMTDGMPIGVVTLVETPRHTDFTEWAEEVGGRRIKKTEKIVTEYAVGDGCRRITALAWLLEAPEPGGAAGRPKPERRWVYHPETKKFELSRPAGGGAPAARGNLPGMPLGAIWFTADYLTEIEKVRAARSGVSDREWNRIDVEIGDTLQGLLKTPIGVNTVKLERTDETSLDDFRSRMRW